MSEIVELSNHQVDVNSNIIGDLQILADDVRSNGGFINENIEFIVSDDKSDKGIGIFTKDYINPGILLIKVPFSLCLSIEMISCDQFLSKVLRENSYLNEMQDEVLALAIMYATNPSVVCEWSNHTRTFPKYLNSTIYWSEDELNELKSCNVYYLTKMMNSRMESDWKSIHEPLIQAYPQIFSGNTFGKYKWALSMVYSRAIGITRNNKYIRCVPILIDMANHSVDVGNDSSDTFEYNSDDNHVYFYNTLSLNSHAECFASYGSYSNSKLAYTYGFVLLDNPVKAVDLWTKVSPSTTFKDTKQKALDTCIITKQQTYDFTGTIRPNYISSALLTTIRVIQLDSDEIEMIEEKLFNNPKKIITIRNELATYTALKKLIEVKVKPEIIGRDRLELESLLQSNTSLSNRKLMALIIRVDEQTLYQVTLILDSHPRHCCYTSKCFCRIYYVTYFII